MTVTLQVPAHCTSTQPGRWTNDCYIASPCTLHLHTTREVNQWLSHCKSLHTAPPHNQGGEPMTVTLQVPAHCTSTQPGRWTNDCYIASPCTLHLHTTREVNQWLLHCKSLHTAPPHNQGGEPMTVTLQVPAHCTSTQPGRLTNDCYIASPCTLHLHTTRQLSKEVKHPITVIFQENLGKPISECLHPYWIHWS